MTSNPDNSLLSRAIRGGDDIGFDLGHGPATYLIVDEVSEIFLALRGVSDEDFLPTEACHVYFRSLEIM